MALVVVRTSQIVTQVEVILGCRKEEVPRIVGSLRQGVGRAHVCPTPLALVEGNNQAVVVRITGAFKASDVSPVGIGPAKVGNASRGGNGRHVYIAGRNDVQSPQMQVAHGDQGIAW